MCMGAFREMQLIHKYNSVKHEGMCLSTCLMVTQRSRFFRDLCSGFIIRFFITQIISINNQI